MPFDAYRVSQLPPYILSRFDALKAKLRAAGQDIFDFGLGNPDGPCPKAVVDRLLAELKQPGFHRYIPSKGLLEPRQAIAAWYRRRYDVAIDPEREAVVTIGSKEGIAHLLLGLVGPGDCVLSPDPGYPIHRYGVVIAGGEPVAYRTGPGRDHLKEIQDALRRSPRRPKGVVVNFPNNPTTATVDARFYERLVELAHAEGMWIISDLAYADLTFDGTTSPSVLSSPRAREVAVEFFTVSKSYSMPGWRVGFCVGNGELVGVLTTMKGYVDYGSFTPTQLAAATALRDCDRDVEDNRARYKHRATFLADALNRAGWKVTPPLASMFLWAPVPEKFADLGSIDFAALLLERTGVVAVPGVGFGPGADGFVRFSLVEGDERARAACDRIAKFLA